jgi:hypothetical protein
MAMHRTLNPGNNGFESLAAHAGVAQLAEAASPNLARCGFESRRPYSMAGGLLAFRPDSDSGVESES